MPYRGLIDSIWFRGSLFEFLRNDRLDSRNFFARSDAPNPPFKLNQYGASLGGPVIRNRTFFFANYEGYREVFGDTQVVTVPVVQIRTGDFRGVAPNGIYARPKSQATVGAAEDQRRISQVH